MGHSVGNAAERAVNKSVKAEAVKARTDEQIFHDMERNLDASLSVPPLDIRLLLKRYREMQAVFNRVVDPIINQAAEELGAAAVEATRVLAESEPIILEMSKNPAIIEELAIAGLKFNTGVLEEITAKHLKDLAEVAEWKDITLVEAEDAASDEIISREEGLKQAAETEAAYHRGLERMNNEGGPNGSEEKEPLGS